MVIAELLLFTGVGAGDAAPEAAQVGRSSRRDLAALPEDVQDVFGSALLDVQYGDAPDGARPFGEGLPREIWKIVEDDDGNTYRAIYTAAFSEAVYVLDAFVKKSKSGIGTPRMV